MVHVYTGDSSTWEAEVEGWYIRGQPGIHSGGGRGAGHRHTPVSFRLPGILGQEDHLIPGV